jgi:inhibitor of KinA
MPVPQYRPVADHAVMVIFADTISDAAHAAVLHLDRALNATPFAGFTESIPAFVSLLVDFDPLLTDHATVTHHLRTLQTAPDTPTPKRTQHQVLVCYDNAPDLPTVAEQTGMTLQSVIAAHLAGDYRVVMYGFAPGYAYLGGVPAALQLDRKPTPVRHVPAGSVIIAGGQCLVTTLTMPTGWWVIGQSPTRILTTDPARPFLFDVGDRVTFRRISQADYDHA